MSSLRQAIERFRSHGQETAQIEEQRDLEPEQEKVFAAVSDLTGKQPVTKLIDVARATFGESDEAIMKTARIMRSLFEAGTVAYNLKTGYTIKRG